MLYKTFWRRVLASLIDSIILWPLILIENDLQDQPSPWLIVGILVMQHSYYVIGHAQFGQTLGKRVSRVRVVRAHQQLPAGWSHAIVRELLWIVASVIFYLSFYKVLPQWAVVVGSVLMSADVWVAIIHPQNRSIRDFMAKTVVIRTDMLE